MKTVNVFDSLKEFGIDVLTGEACALSMRLLCELTPEMMETYLAYTGIKVSIEQVKHSDWNNPEKYAVFLTHEVMEDLVIMRLMDENELVVEILPNEQNSKGFSMQKFLLAGSSEEIKEYCKDKFDNSESSFYKMGRSYWIYREQPRVGFSNVHHFTGMVQ